MTVKLVKVPTLVKLDPVTVDFKVVPVKVPASAVTVIFAVPSNATPFIFLAVANLVAVPALPVVVVAVPAVVAVVAVPAFPVILPAIGLVTVKLVKVPTLVKPEVTTLLASAVPVNVFASTAIVISTLPSNVSPLMFLAVANLVAEAALPVVVLAVPAVVAVEAFPVILPAIGLVTVKLVKVPTLVKPEVTTLLASAVPVNVFASTAIVISTLPSNVSPLMFLAVANLVAEAALPVGVK